VYQHCGFRGYGVRLPLGWYNLRKLRRMGIRNDDLSSIRVPRGYVVTLFEHVNFRGRRIRLTHSDNCFVNNGFNDIVSSIKVERIRRVDSYPPVRPVQPPHPPVHPRRMPTVYQHCGFRGYGVRLPLGWYNLRKLRRMGIRNDDLSSIRVPRGYVVTLYEHVNFRGRRIRLTHSDRCFVNNGFNDIVSSIKVERRPYRY
jgi:hypothetical protein